MGDRLISDLRRQERKIERVEGQVSAKEAELQSQAGKVGRSSILCTGGSITCSVTCLLTAVEVEGG